MQGLVLGGAAGAERPRDVGCGALLPRGSPGAPLQGIPR